MKTRIAVVSPTSRIVGDVAAAFAALWPEAELSQIIDDTIYQDCFDRGEGITPKLEARILALLKHAEAAGAAAMMFSGSVFGEMIEKLRPAISVPVLTSSEGLVSEAFAAGNRFAILSTVQQSIEDLKRDIERHAKKNGLTYTVSEHVEEGVRHLFEAGERDRHDRALVEASARFGDVDALLLPNFSLTSAHAAMPKVAGRTVLCASRSSIGLLKRLTGH